MMVTADPVSIIACCRLLLTCTLTKIGFDDFDDIMLVVDGFCFILLESPPSRVPASRKPADNHVFDDRIVHIYNTHMVFYNNNQMNGDYFAGI